MAKQGKRVRRTPEDARALILDAAQKTMGAEGPAALRLQDVAKEAGVSHPTILHHFGSREGLVKALNHRSLEALRNGVIARLDSAQKTEFAGNAIALDERQVWMSARAAASLHPEQRASLAGWGFALRSVELSEIEKAGGSLRCCVGEIF